MHAEIEFTCEPRRVSTGAIHVLIWANEALVAGMNEESLRSISRFLSLSFSLLFYAMCRELVNAARTVLAVRGRR